VSKYTETHTDVRVPIKLNTQTYNQGELNVRRQLCGHKNASLVKWMQQ